VGGRQEVVGSRSIMFQTEFVTFEMSRRRLRKTWSPDDDPAAAQRRFDSRSFRLRSTYPAEGERRLRIEAAAKLFARMPSRCCHMWGRTLDRVRFLKQGAPPSKRGSETAHPIEIGTIQRPSAISKVDADLDLTPGHLRACSPRC